MLYKMGVLLEISEIGLELYPDFESYYGVGLPYDPIDFPNAGDKWGRRAGKRVSSSGTFRYRYLYLMKKFKAPKSVQKNDFRSSDYDGYSYVRCEVTIDGYICGHISHLDCSLQDYMAGKVGGNINLNAQYLCRYCDSRMDLVPHGLKLINTCTSISSRADTEKILNVGICILLGSQKRSGKELLHDIESINA
ncbi:hypothetical protein EJD97_002190 [Solanum chilense]|uniref:Uncharacterized protein n=1 Tax=Solanum chilense TaxID=4083 RepID=A0A6N2ATY5_SOLCI|nr:hypothetical protein EJD97_002190 [Solanum chilense]